jgi:hypothetical protein
MAGGVTSGNGLRATPDRHGRGIPLEWKAWQHPGDERIRLGIAEQHQVLLADHLVCQVLGADNRQFAAKVS